MALDEVWGLAAIIAGMVGGLGGLLVSILAYRRSRNSAKNQATTDSAQTTALERSASAQTAQEKHLASLVEAANTVMVDQAAILNKFEARLRAVEDRLPDLAKPDPRVAALEAIVKSMSEMASRARTGLIPISDGPAVLRRAEADRVAVERATALKQQELDLQRRRLEMDEARAQSEANWRVWNEFVKPAIFPEKKRRR